MKICEALALLNEYKQLNEGFYAYHCTRAQIEEFDDSHDNKESGRGAFWGPGTYFEILDRDGNFDDYGDESYFSGYRKGKGQQYKVYIDLKPEQILDTNKSFNDYGMTFSLEEAFDFIINSPLMYRWSTGFHDKLEKFLKLKKEHNNFNTIADKRKAYGKLIRIIDLYTKNVITRLRNHNHTGRSKSLFSFKILIDTGEKSNFLYDIERYAKAAVEFLGNDDYNPDIETKIKEDVATGYRHPAGAEALLNIIKFLGDSKKIEKSFNKYIQFFFKMVKLSLNKLPMSVFLNHRFSMEDIRWCMEKFGVYGKIVPEKGLNDGKPRQYLIMWKTTGIVKKVGERYKKAAKFSDEFEDEAQSEEINDMLQYAGAL